MQLMRQVIVVLGGIDPESAAFAKAEDEPWVFDAVSALPKARPDRTVYLSGTAMMSVGFKETYAS